MWWSFLAGGLLTTFFLLIYGGKADVLTEVELIELDIVGEKRQFWRGFGNPFI
ncbi:MAG: hypothetical protein R2728_11245 [Chitinophagales bacterium]